MTSQIRKIQRQMARDNAYRPPILEMVPEYEWPEHYDPKRIEVWISNKYLVQVFTEDNFVLRVSVCRTSVRQIGGWSDGLSWDDLQDIKRQIGREDSYAIEVYPRDRDIVNVANMRHLWILPEPLDVGWFA